MCVCVWDVTDVGEVDLLIHYVVYRAASIITHLATSVLIGLSCFCGYQCLCISLCKTLLHFSILFTFILFIFQSLPCGTPPLVGTLFQGSCREPEKMILECSVWFCLMKWLWPMTLNVGELELSKRMLA